MKNFKFIKQKISISVITTVLGVANVAHAQESANPKLDACVKDEQIALTAKGAGLGAMAGLGASLFSSNKEDALKKAAIGAAVGGVAGFATAYFTAVDNCFKKDPSLIPESKIELTQDYAQIKKAAKYKPSQGIRAEATKLEMPGSVKAGTMLDVVSFFQVLTPDGAETQVMIERKLFAIVEGKETQVTFSGKTSEQRTLPAGGHKDISHLPIPAKAQAGTQYRVEFSISADGKPASTVQGTVTVE